MKYILTPATIFCFMLYSAGSAFGQGTQQGQSHVQPVLIEYNGAQELVDPAVLMELDPAGFKQDENGRPYVIIEGRKVIVDAQGVQSLAQPGAIPSRKEEPAKNPE
jgi:hypothetical protein